MTRQNRPLPSWVLVKEIEPLWLPAAWSRGSFMRYILSNDIET